MKQIKDRGWMWDTSEKPTQWVAYYCYNCREVSVYPSNYTPDICKECYKAPLAKSGYVRKVKEVKT